MMWLLYIRRLRGWQTVTGDMDRVPQPWERTDKGSKWPNSGSFGKERESELAGHSLGKKWESPGGRQRWPSRERLMEPEQESCECCWELSPQCPARMLPSPPTPLDTHTHMHCSPHPASGHGFLGSFPPIRFPSSPPSIREPIEVTDWDRWMLKLVVAELWLSLSIPHLFLRNTGALSARP